MDHYKIVHIIDCFCRSKTYWIQIIQILETQYVTLNYITISLAPGEGWGLEPLLQGPIVASLI